MTLTTHAIAGAAIAQFFPQHIVVAFVLAFASHFLLDAIPHWDYKIYSIQEPQEWGEKLKTDIDVRSPVFIYDLFRIGSDFWIGMLLPLIIFSALPVSPLVTLAGALGGMLPDPLQFAYWKLRYEPLITLQKIHIWFAARKELKDQPLIGIPFQLGIIIALIAITYVVKIKII